MKILFMKKVPWDTLTLLLVLALVGVGLMTLYSASYIVSETRYGTPYQILKMQMIYVCLGLFLMWFLQKIPYQIWAKLSYPILALILILLILVLIPGIGYEVKGARRWLRIAGYSIQPSELLKLGIVFYLAYSLVEKKEQAGTFLYGILPHILVLTVVILPVLAGIDLGTAVVIVAIALTIMFVAGVPTRYLLGMGVSSLPVLYYLIVSKPYRLKRIASFMNPWEDPQGTGYHMIHSIYAFASGGMYGVGPGSSRQKLLYLPEPHTDFIFSILGEELGFVGVLLVSILFLTLLVRGLMIALSAKDDCGTYLATGLTMIVAIPAFLNMAVVLNLLPTKGLPLPFFSQGGTNLVVCFIAMGILLNIAGQAKEAQLNLEKRPILAAAKGII